MKKSGYTLAEALISLGIIGIIAAILLPLINGIKVNEEKVMYLKAHDSVINIVKNLAKNSREYNICKDINAEESANCSKVPLFNTQKSFSNPDAVGDEKLCRLMADALNGKDVACSSEVYPAASYSDSTVFNPPSFVTQNGMRWRVSPQIQTNFIGTERGQFEAAIYVDVNGSEKGKNCLYDSVNCTNPDIFKFLVGANGDVVPADAKGVSYLGNRKSWIGKDSTGTVGTIASTFSLTPCKLSAKHELCINSGGTWNSSTGTCRCRIGSTWDDVVGCKAIEDPVIDDPKIKKDPIVDPIGGLEIKPPKEDSCSKKMVNFVRIVVGPGGENFSNYSVSYNCNSFGGNNERNSANACIEAEQDPATPISVTIGGTQYSRAPITMDDKVVSIGTIRHFEEVYIESISPKCDDKYAYEYNTNSGNSGYVDTGKSDGKVDFKLRY